MDLVLATARITRPHAGLLAAMYTVLGAYLAGSQWTHHVTDVIRAAVAIALIVAFGFVINDYHDIELDIVTKSYRPIPSGRLSPRYALSLACALALLAVLVALSISIPAGTIAALLVVGSAAYSYFLKATMLLGIGMVAVLNASTVLFGCLAAGAVSPAAALLTAIAFLNGGAQETLYNVRDRPEDARYEIKTTAVRLGEGPTLQLFSALAIGCAVATVVPWLMQLGSQAYIWAVLPCCTLPLLGVVILVLHRANQDSFYLAHSILKLLRLSSVLPVLLLRSHGGL